MKWRRFSALALTVSLLLCGCHREENGRENRPTDVEPTASYDWMAGESPVPVKRIGVERFDVSGGKLGCCTNWTQPFYGGSIKCDFQGKFSLTILLSGL